MVTVLSKDPYLHIPANSRFLTTDWTGVGGRAAVFLDRDGVIIEDVHFLTGVESIRLLPGVGEALRFLMTRFYLVVVSNQSGVARGFITEQDLLEIHSELVGRLNEQGVMLDALYYCPHLPEGPVQAFSQKCECRKPKPGMILRAMQDWKLRAESSFMVGDSPRDVEAGQRAGVRSLLIGQGAENSPYGSLGDVVDLMMLDERRTGASVMEGNQIIERPDRA